jgi:3-methyladenine DNA glycosylase AlkD
MNDLNKILSELKSLANKEKAAILSRFFKTGKGEYGEGDLFLGITVPDQRKLAKKYVDSVSKAIITSLLNSPIHECRLTGILMLCMKFNSSRKNHEEKQWVDLYLKRINCINNWDLVDSSAHIILGQWLEDKERGILYKYANDDSLWKNRVAIITTLHFIKNNDIKDLLKISKIMLSHQHDLIHKATGWMLREAWKRKPVEIENFIAENASNMPRTMLRYAIEKMSPKKRAALMQVKQQKRTLTK